jgi:hypothetical protein
MGNRPKMGEIYVGLGKFLGNHLWNMGNRWEIYGRLITAIDVCSENSVEVCSWENHL